MEVLNKSHFSLQIENCPIPVAEHSGLYLVHFEKTYTKYNQSTKASVHRTGKDDDVATEDLVFAASNERGSLMDVCLRPQKNHS